MKDILKVYNRESEKKIKAQTISDRPAQTMLAKMVPKSKIKPDSENWNDDNCWWCQDLPRIKVTPDVIVWCERCYVLHFQKMDGSYIQSSLVPVFKQLLEDSKDKEKMKKMQSISMYSVEDRTKFIQE